MTDDPDREGGGATPEQTSSCSSVIHHTECLAGIAGVPDASVKTVLLSLPSLSRPTSGPDVFDGLAVLYLSCKKATGYVVFFWRLRELPRPPIGWYEVGRHVWHNPNTATTQYELVIAWSKNPTIEPGRVWSIPLPQGQRSKPVRLWRHLVARYTAEGEQVLVPFAGVGNALLACQQLGRPSVGLESNGELARLAATRLQGQTLSSYDKG